MSKRNHPTGNMGKHKRPGKIYGFQEADARLYDIFRNHGFENYPHAKRHQLVRFYELLMKQQMTENFTRLISLKDVGIKHFIDCLKICELTEFQFPLVDMGTGPGFPGIPLKVEFPDEKMILIDGVRKRIDFLKQIRKKMNLENLDLMGRNVTQDFVYPVKGVITRAVMDTSDTLRNVSQCLEVGGKLYLMKGPNVDEELDRAQETWRDYFLLTEDHAYTLPNTPHHRRLIVFEKTKTPDYQPKLEDDWDD
ncbi:MAG: 16S rRNA (guanine(527)-N(7))-methyltransferase RsmG [Bdellovibrionales bacterium]|nr:16S rRNA (guanine(527)-N(7))-methyltransferase RsmG [Bdellovibrionales bacterium]